MTVFGNGAFKEEMKIQCGHEGGALIHYDWCPWKRTHTREEASGETNPTGSSILEKISFCCSSHTVCGILSGPSGLRRSVES